MLTIWLTVKSLTAYVAKCNETVFYALWHGDLLNPATLAADHSFSIDASNLSWKAISRCQCIRNPIAIILAIK